MHLKKNDYNKHTNFYLKSTINQNNKIFKFSSNKQCTAICAYAIGFSSVVPIKDWNVKILDRVIREGNNYYNHCQFLLRQNNIIYTSFLAVDEILEEIELNNKVLRLSQYLDYEYDNTRQGDLKKNDLIKHLEEFTMSLPDCKSLLIIIKCFTFAIIKHLDHVYLVDSHEHFGKQFGSNAYVKKIHEQVAAQEINNHFNDIFTHSDNCIYTISFIEVLEKKA